eukprot:CAMPEP_0198131970 /NCGR_PEP_ID=MMETSP1442-20131203/57382_1 /TAXON_ID= /ORGANISM="Craspedostauros australis, Strain CCMP3328" /LENGTH=70 /DNA_ID=CAMNT_0043792885 /DNA_START=503 /DNA_END=712 /DNA_ORIENTATION=-
MSAVGYYGEVVSHESLDGSKPRRALHLKVGVVDHANVTLPEVGMGIGIPSIIVILILAIAASALVVVVVA